MPVDFYIGDWGLEKLAKNIAGTIEECPLQLVMFDGSCSDVRFMQERYLNGKNGMEFTKPKSWNGFWNYAIHPVKGRGVAVFMWCFDDELSGLPAFDVYHLYHCDMDSDERKAIKEFKFPNDAKIIVYSSGYASDAVKEMGKDLSDKGYCRQSVFYA